MKLRLALVGVLALSGLVWAEDVDDSYAALQKAVNDKDAAEVLKLAPTTAKLANELAAKPKPADDSQADYWKQRVEFGKQVSTFAEYALASTAVTSEPAKTVEMVDALIDLNPKTQYLSVCAQSYLAALTKTGGAAKATAGAEKILKASPQNEDALYALASGYMSSRPAQAQTYATRLVGVMRSKAKPEGVTAEAWEQKKSIYLGQGYYISGAAAGAASSWKDCDTNLRAALPYIGKDPNMGSVAYFYLGLANYQLGKLTGDRSKMAEGQKFSEQSAAMGGPMAAQASRNAQVIKNELATPVGRR